MKKHWHILTPDPHSVEHIASELNISDITSAVLVNRGIVTTKQALSFMNICIEDIRSPFEIKDIDKAVKRIYQAIEDHETILIFGDYDADGITATAILSEFLTYAGATAISYIPHRKKEGYSLQVHHIKEYAIPNAIGLIITADCGSNSHDAIRTAKQAGIDVIVIDHHNLSEDLPDAEAVVNPKRSDCHSCFHDLSGVGMAFCVLICLRKYMRDTGLWNTLMEPNLKNACDLVALGTMADIVPLTNENRIFVKAGLDMIRYGVRPGLQALIEASNINKASVSEEDIAFKLAPRLNAAGRMDHAYIGVELLLETDLNRARNIARNLNKMNTKRQQIEQTILDDIAIYVKKHPQVLDHKSLVMANKKWDEGVLGIVASKLVEKYFRPVVLFAINGDTGKGSARSIPGFNLYDGLCSCAFLLKDFGGHKMAAGLKIDATKIEQFKEIFNAIVHQNTTEQDFIPWMPIDRAIDFDDISTELIDEIERLKPFGSGNAEPIFMAQCITVLSSNIVGGNHRRMRLGQDFSKKNKVFNAIWFNIPREFESIDHFEKIAFQVRWNRWNGNQSIQLTIVDAFT